MSINFALALALLNMSSMRAGRVLLVLYALELGAAPSTVGLLAATFSIFPALLSMQAGRLADRLVSRPLLILGALGGGLLFDLLGNYDLAWQLGVGCGLIAGTLQIVFAAPKATSERIQLS